MASEDPLTCKIVLVGETGVGKTAIISRYTLDTFKKGQQPSTMASRTMKEIIIPEFNRKLKFDIWDTAGQEKYRALTKFFYKDAAIAIMVYDITRRESFDEVSNYWSTQVRECASESLIIGIAGNKSDLFDQEQVKEMEGKTLAKELGAVYQLTSAMNGSGIITLFQKLGSEYLTYHKRRPSQQSDARRQLKNENAHKKKKKCC